MAESTVEVSVSDSGTGIPEHELGQIFEAFYTTKEQGTGLGLSVAHTIIETYEGKIWAENQAGGGAVVHFTLPLIEDSVCGPAALPHRCAQREAAPGFERIELRPGEASQLTLTADPRSLARFETGKPANDFSHSECFSQSFKSAESPVRIWYRRRSARAAWVTIRRHRHATPYLHIITRVDMLLCCAQTALTPRLGLLVACISELETTDKSDGADRSSGQSEHVVVGSSMTR